MRLPLFGMGIDQLTREPKRSNFEQTKPNAFLHFGIISTQPEHGQPKPWLNR